MSATITVTTVSHIADLSNIPLQENEKQKLAEGFTKTLRVVEELLEVDTVGVESTHQVTGLENILRADEVDEDRMFSQTEALENVPKHRQHNGYILVGQIIGE